MFAARYLWRQLNQKQQEELLAWRKARGHPWHSPPHRYLEQTGTEEAKRIWREYPIRDYGKGWDEVET